MHYYIITGTSRGIGEALAYALLAEAHQLFCISRSDNQPLKQASEKARCPMTYYQQDLAQTYDAQHLMGMILSQIEMETAKSLTFIQNAAVVSPISAIGKDTVQAEALVRSVNLNITTPILMTDAFVAATQEWPIPKKILNISSGAARKAAHALSAYCVSKAALDMHSRCLALEQETEVHPIEVVCIAPGVVDTEMQAEIREQPREVFHGVDRFLTLKEEKKLWSPDFVADELIKLLQEPNFGQVVIQDLRDRV